VEVVVATDLWCLLFACRMPPLTYDQAVLERRIVMYMLGEQRFGNQEWFRGIVTSARMRAGSDADGFVFEVCFQLQCTRYDIHIELYNRATELIDSIN
jgi:hypothetical protein